ncbi:SHOCT domain-containing protein [Natronomonas gomsonensis]|uniref:SHOCT domain-containing protein n=1 Tax=Natronomonas gomsonensis TaxID=1046043 RepID=UPI0015C18937|nr:SHOCT domain-containing protein [Natronomonas gomsonensis]
MSEKRSDLTTVLLVVLGILVLWPLLMMGFGGMGMMGYGGMMSGPYSDGGYSIVGVVLQLVFVIVLLGGGYLLARRLIGHQESRDEALEELRVAYARGDLSDEAFETRRERLKRDE